MPAKKPSIAIGNSPLLLAPFRDLRRRGGHDRDVNLGHGNRAKTLRAWPRGLADRVVQGIAALRVAVASALFEEDALPATGSRTSAGALRELERLEQLEAPPR